MGQSPPRNINIVSVIDAAYIAGLIDGEGTITLSRKHKDDFRQLAVSIVNTERQLLTFVLNTFNVGKITTRTNRMPHHLPVFTYAVYNRHALSLLEQITPFLKSNKAERAKLILSEYLCVTPRNGKYTEALLQRKTAFETGVLSIKPA